MGPATQHHTHAPRRRVCGPPCPTCTQMLNECEEVAYSLLTAAYVCKAEGMDEYRGKYNANSAVGETERNTSSVLCKDAGANSCAIAMENLFVTTHANFSAIEQREAQINEALGDAFTNDLMDSIDKVKAEELKARKDTRARIEDPRPRVPCGTRGTHRSLRKPHHGPPPHPPPPPPPPPPYSVRNARITECPVGPQFGRLGRGRLRTVSAAARAVPSGDHWRLSRRTHRLCAALAMHARRRRQRDLARSADGAPADLRQRLVHLVR